MPFAEPFVHLKYTFSNYCYQHHMLLKTQSNCVKLKKIYSYSYIIQYFRIHIWKKLFSFVFFSLQVAYCSYILDASICICFTMF